jgi:ATP-dependent helicase/nuclease subunit B
VSAAAPKVYTIPAGRPFLDDLARGLIARFADPADPLKLAGLTVLVPTRRAARALAAAFVTAADGAAAILPVIRPLGDADEDETLIAEGIDLAPEVPRLERSLTLASLVARFRPEAGFAGAFGLAAELGRFFDECAQSGADLRKLDGLAGEDYAGQWQEALAFLKIATGAWPDYLAGRGLMDPSARGAEAVLAFAARLSRAPQPVVAAGSSGTQAATRKLLATIAHLPDGAVVLNGLDTGLDPASWDALGDSHPQAALKDLLGALRITRGAVALWPESAAADAPRKARTRLLSDALRPAETTADWADPGRPGAALAAPGLEGLSLVEAANEREEALAIAIAMRLHLEDARETAALVTPDRELGRRVAAELERWGIAADQSGGTPLAKTPAGTLALLSAEAAASGFAPVALLGLLKHPLVLAGSGRAAHLAAISRLERLALRGAVPEPGLDGVRALCESKLKAKGLAAPLDLLGIAYTDYLDADTIAARAAAHVTTLLRLAPGFEDAEGGAETLGLLGALSASPPEADPEQGPAAYATLLTQAARTETVRPWSDGRSRAFIWGPLEARLQGAGLLVLGGLNEGTWPALPGNDPWMNRAMRKSLGLPAPERRIGLAAHDFEVLAAAPRVILSRARRRAGSPETPSRFLVRLKTLLEGTGLALPEDRALGFARLLDETARLPPAARPSPAPPVALRPRCLPVTRIETWVRDPYAVYARHVLGLKKLDPLEPGLGPGARGSILHKALEMFTRDYPDALPEDAVARLVERLRAALGSFAQDASLTAFLLPRFQAAAAWFLEIDAGWRAEARTTGAEIEGAWQIPGFDFTLTGKADRIDLLHAGGLRIADYKSGTVPSGPQVEKGLSPQMPLLGAIAEADGFPEPFRGPVSDLAYVKLGGGASPGVLKPLTAPSALIAETAARLKARIRQFDDPATPYVSRAVPMKERETGDYDHLARVAEWTEALDAEPEA